MMSNALRYIVVLVFLPGLLVMSGCASIREQGRLALGQVQNAAAGGMTGGAGTRQEDDFWWEEPPPVVHYGPLGHLRGEVAGVLYINDFVDVYFAPPSGWTMELSESDVFERDGIDMFSAAPEGTYSNVTFIFRPGVVTMSEDEYWAQRLSELQARGFEGGDFMFDELGFNPHTYRTATISVPEGFRRYYMRLVEGYSLTIILQAEQVSDLDELTVCFA